MDYKICIAVAILIRMGPLKADLHSTILSPATSLRHAYDTF